MSILKIVAFGLATTMQRIYVCYARSDTVPVLLKRCRTDNAEHTVPIDLTLVW